MNKPLILMAAALAALVVAKEVPAASCYVIASNGQKWSRITSGTSYTATRYEKPCAVQPLIIEYDNPRGMKLYTNPQPGQIEQCLYLRVDGRELRAYSALQIINGEYHCPQE